jgi:hypothetical protein
MKKDTRGGSRPGSGRKQKSETITMCFRVAAELRIDAQRSFGRTLNKRFIEWLTSITYDPKNYKGPEI